MLDPQDANAQPRGGRSRPSSAIHKEKGRLVLDAGAQNLDVDPRFFMPDPNTARPVSGAMRRPNSATRRAGASSATGQQTSSLQHTYGVLTGEPTGRAAAALEASEMARHEMNVAMGRDESYGPQARATKKQSDSRAATWTSLRSRNSHPHSSRLLSLLFNPLSLCQG